MLEPQGFLAVQAWLEPPCAPPSDDPPGSIWRLSLSPADLVRGSLFFWVVCGFGGGHSIRQLLGGVARGGSQIWQPRDPPAASAGSGLCIGIREPGAPSTWVD
ncbi:hypothetical protein SLEP1_g29433 [Rubroshorea leprosula]|uniref:Uncharacterized protein n=1 Tax=Rubroshorea leprosula TaxID=152421 RepID=A0AAV5K7J8_9ROSI|nr:hypothetical protein SLEP1_g29433 [Rubroshorea leprosula]